MTACPPCHEQQMKWLDSKPSDVLRGGIQFNSHAAYDDTPAGMQDNARGRHERWATLVREQMAGIAQACKTAGHPQRPAPPAYPQHISQQVIDQPRALKAVA